VNFLDSSLANKRSPLTLMLILLSNILYVVSMLSNVLMKWSSLRFSTKPYFTEVSFSINIVHGKWSTNKQW